MICRAPCQRIKASESGSASPSTRHSRGGLGRVMQDLDQVLVMTVEPRIWPAAFLHTTSRRSLVRQMIDRTRSDCELEVDGGVDAVTPCWPVAAGANVLVAGSAIFTNGLASPPPWNGAGRGPALNGERVSCSSR